MKNILTTSILALAGLALTVPAANAELTYSTNDLVVAFSTTIAPGHTGNTLLINFGNLTDFLPLGQYATGNIVTVNAGLGSSYLADLTSAGITNFSTAAFSIQSADFDDPNGLTLSKAETTKGTGSVPFLNGAGQAGVANADILSMMFSFGTAAASSTTANSFIQNTNDTASYGKYVFGGQSVTQAYEAYTNPEGLLNSSDANRSRVLDLYKITDGNTNATRVGGFEFNTATGALNFSTDITDFAPVPEPSTAMFAVSMLGIVAARRARRTTVAA